MSEGLKVIAQIFNDFPTKFGLSRQSGLNEALISRVVFEKEFRVPEALRGIEQFSHLWLLWGFSETERAEWSPTVRPPRLGGNRRVGVFATRSPFRPNSIGMSCVRLLRVEHSERDGEVLIVAGADMMSGTPIFDVKPYIPLADCRIDAVGGFSDTNADYHLEVVFPSEQLALVPMELRAALFGALRGDPRPSYQNDAERVYGFRYADLEVKFSVDGSVLTVKNVEKV